jgi:hypothetical protein
LTQSGAKCWGDNWNGELGVNTNMQPHPVPISVSGETTDFVQISSGGHHGCAVTESGGAKCWGLNTSGQLGIGMSGSAFDAPQVVVAAMVKSTPTPTPSPTPCPPMACPVDFHLSVDSDPTLGVACETSGGSTSCAAPAGSTLHVEVYLDALADGLPYQAVQVLLDYAGVTPDGSLHIYTVWPDCSAGAEVVQPTYLVTSCSLLYVPPYSTYLGVIGLADFTCSSTGSLTLAHGASATLLIDDNGVTHYETTGDETVTIDCVDPAAYPIDTDGDGCPDMNEALPSPLSGGERNFLNPYDYFNPSHDGQNRIDDILDVVDQYYIDSGNPNYNPDTDRTLLGPNAWNLGPPNGQQRVDDILNMVYQYYHDCS